MAPTAGETQLKLNLLVICHEIWGIFYVIPEMVDGNSAGKPSLNRQFSQVSPKHGIAPLTNLVKYGSPIHSHSVLAVTCCSLPAPDQRPVVGMCRTPSVSALLRRWGSIPPANSRPWEG